MKKRKFRAFRMGSKELARSEIDAQLDDVQEDVEEEFALSRAYMGSMTDEEILSYDPSIRSQLYWERSRGDADRELFASIEREWWEERDAELFGYADESFKESSRLMGEDCADDLCDYGDCDWCRDYDSCFRAGEPDYHDWYAEHVERAADEYKMFKD